MWAKLRWFGILLLGAGLVCCVLFFQRMEQHRFCGLRIRDEMSLEAACSGKSPENPALWREMLLYQGNPLPFEERKGIFYVTQNPLGADFTGRFHAADSGMEIYMASDDYLDRKEDAIRENHLFNIWIIGEESYTVCPVMFTGLPVAEIQVEREINGQEAAGSVRVWNAEDETLRTTACRASEASVKISVSGNTWTVRLRKPGGEKGSRVSLLNLGRAKAWKLYAVSDTDESCVRAALAYDTWNQICTNDALKRPWGLTEVIANGVYRGLFLLLPRLDDETSGMEKNRVTHLELEKHTNLGVPLWNGQNLTEYALFVRTAFAAPNRVEEMYRVDGPVESFLSPAKIRYAWGDLPAKYEYLLLNKNLTLKSGWLLEEARDVPALEEDISGLWRKLRQGPLATENILRRLDILEEVIRLSGVLSRRGIDDRSFELAEADLRLFIREWLEMMETYDVEG